MKRLFALFCVILLAGCTRQRPSTTEVIDRADTTTITETTYLDVAPNPRERHIHFASLDERVECNPNYLSYFIEEKFDKDFSEPLAAIDELIRLHNLHETTRIASLDDIPGYANAPLAPDLKNIDIGLHDRWISEQEREIVVYTYTQIGGDLKRYVFHIFKNNHFRCSSCTIIGRRIGNAHFLQ